MKNIIKSWIKELVNEYVQVFIEDERNARKKEMVEMEARLSRQIVIRDDNRKFDIEDKIS